MESDLNDTNFDPRVTELLTGIRRMVAETPDPEQLRQRLEDRVVDIDEVKSAITIDQMIGDGVLENIGITFASRFLKGPTRREYIVLTKCKPCADSGNRHRVEGSKRELHVPSTRYVHEAELNEALDADTLPDCLDEGQFKTSCPQCGSKVEITSTSNIIYPLERQPIYAISQRVKSAGRYRDKLVDRIFFDMIDPRIRRTRSLTDRYASAFILQSPNGTKEDELRRNFRRQYGVEVPAGNFEDMVCYAIRDVIDRTFRNSISKVQDSIARPLMKKSRTGTIEAFKMLQFNIAYLGKKSEVQLKSLSTYNRERDRRSAINHQTYVETEKQLRAATYENMPQAKVVCDILTRIFTTRQGAI